MLNLQLEFIKLKRRSFLLSLLLLAVDLEWRCYQMNYLKHMRPIMPFIP